MLLNCNTDAAGRWITTLFFVLIALLLLSSALLTPFDHDEHQFLVPALLINQGQHPYIDFPHFHLPMQAYIYAGVFQLTGHPVAAARILNALAALATAGVIYLFARGRFRSLAPTQSAMRHAPTALAAMWAFHWTCSYTAGRTWNHALPTLLAVIAFVLLYISVEQPRRLWLLLLSGMALGLATSMRITWLPVGLAFGLGLIFLHPPQQRRLPATVIRIILLGAGVAIAWLPIALLISRAPQTFWYGVHDFPLADRQVFIAKGDDVSLLHKLGSSLAVMLRAPSGMIIFTMLSLITVQAIRLHRRAAIAQPPGNTRRSLAPVIIALLVLFFVCVGTFAPTAIHRQYAYEPTTFAILAAVVILACLIKQGDAATALGRKIALCGLLVFITGLWAWPNPLHLLDSTRWVPVKAQAMGDEIAGYLGPDQKGKVMTVTPLFPMLGSRPIYLPFAVGQFVWRTAPYTDPAGRKAAGIVGPDEFDALMKKDKPAALLTGMERGEETFVKYALDHGFRRIDLIHCIRDDQSAVLWLRADVDDNPPTGKP